MTNTGAFSARAMRMILAAFAACAIVACVFASPALADEASSPLAQSGSWVKKSGCAYYKLSGGAYATGLTNIDGKTYYFDKKGVQRTGWRKINGSYRYFKIANGAKGSMVKSKVVNGIKLYKNGIAKENKIALAELKLMYAAQKQADKVTKPYDSLSSKLRKCFLWLWKDCRERGSYSFSAYSGWHRPYAWDIFKTKSGSCDSMGAAYAYLANAVGAKSAQVRASGGHTWARVNGGVCDAEQAKQGRGWNVYMNPTLYGSAGVYNVVINPRTKQWSTAKATNAKAAKQKDGWVKSGSKFYYYKAGKKLKSKWLEKSGKTFYLTKSGAMATKSAKVKGVYYVFGVDGALQVGKKTRTVKIDGVSYRVTKKGKASAGWTSGNRRYYLPTGELATGARWVNNKLMVFNAKGAYNAALTNELAPLCKEGADATRLVEALGQPLKRVAVSSCRPGYLGGEEVTYTYDHITLYTVSPEEGPEQFNYIEAR